jgi:molybdopterin-guanine dinucleotide biosynthesis protein A
MPSIDRASISAYILAGGNSSRFGSDKARALLDAQPLIQRVAESLREHANSLTAFARHGGDYDDLGIQTIADVYPGDGPLAGLHAALHDATTGWVLLVSCDFIVIKPQWLTLLLNAATDIAPAIAFRHEFWEPLFALYSRSLLPMVESHLSRRQLAMQHLLDAAGAIAVPMPRDWPVNAHINTPGELAQARDRWGRR